MRFFRKLFIYGCLLLITFLTAVVSLTYFYQDQIIQQFVAQANQYLKTPVKVRQITLSAFDKFPHIALTFDDLVMYEGIEGSTDTLLAARHLYCTFNLLDLWRRNYTIREVYLAEGVLNLKINEHRQNNYTVFKTPNRTAARNNQRQPIHFDIRKIRLDRMLVQYEDVSARQHYVAFADHLLAGLTIAGSVYQTELKGNLTTEKIALNQDIYFQNKPLQIEASLSYDDESKLLLIRPSEIGVQGSAFLVEGSYQNRDIKLEVEGRNTDIQTLVSLLPAQIARKLAVYRSEGDVYFSGTVAGSIDHQHNPAVVVNFGCKNATFYHPESRKAITQATLTGSFTNGQHRQASTSELLLKDIVGVLEGKQISGEFFLRNFTDQYIRVRAKGEIDINSALAFYPLPAFEDASGTLAADFEVEGRVRDFQNISRRKEAVKSTGDITLKDIGFWLKGSALPYFDFNGNFLFRENDLAISNFSGQVGNSHFLLNGFLKNIIPYLLTKDQAVRIDADLQSRFIDMDELLSGNRSTFKESSAKVVQANWETETEAQKYQFSISPQLTLSFACDIDKLKFRRFRGENISGKLWVNKQIAEIRQMQVHTTGGTVKANGTINARHPNAIQVSADTRFNGIDINDVFYVFHDFNQDFLTARHIKGKAFADVHWNMWFDRRLVLDQDKLTVDILATVKDGELNYFEPLQRLSKYVEEENLTHTRFGEISNHIRIVNRTIHIPPMQIHSNVSNITLQGTHTFDHHIDYHFQVPMRSLKTQAARARQARMEQTFGAVEDGKPTFLFLTAKGTTADYKIGYDMPAATEKIKENWKEEGQELKDAFEHKGRNPDKKIKLAAEEEEYFDFEEKP
jgi:hypothetical protein